jgi:3'(2'), 5'-bisphosphate nucleotidase
MEEKDDDQKKLNLFSKSEQDDYSKELDVAVRAVQMACSLCQRVQDTLISKTNHQVQSKDDNSPVTVAGQFFPHLGHFIIAFAMFFLC